MYRNKIILLTICFASIVNLFSIETHSTNRADTNSSGFGSNTITEKGAWCWFADPRAIHYSNEKGTINSTYIGYIDVQGNIKATQIDHLNNKKNEVLIRSWFQPDDHNNPTFLVLPDERIMIFYSRHTDEACFYYRISQKPGDITTLGKEVKLATTHNTTYPSPFILSDDPDHIYLCWRGINWHPTIARLTMPDANNEVRFDWGPHQIVRSKDGAGGVRPYAKYQSNGKDKISLAYTTTHPDNQSINYVYFNDIDINTKELKDIRGNTLSTIGDGTLHNVDAIEGYKNDYPFAVVDDSPLRNWIWETSKDTEGNPVIAMVSISDNKESHDYYHVRWTGTEWRKTFLSNAGGHFHQTPGLEKCYSGGIAIDKGNPYIIYASVPEQGKHGLVYELKKFIVTADGDLASTEQLTFDSPKNNARPFVISEKEGSPQMAWMHGDYFDWIVSASHPQGFPTAIHTNIAVPSDHVDLEKGLLLQKQIGNVTSNDNRKIKVPASKAFTLVVTVAIDTSSYQGEILKTKDFTYGLSSGDLPKPFVRTKTDLHSSTNVLGTSDVWQKQKRGTAGKWYSPEKLGTFQLAISYKNGEMRTYINGLIDQYIETGNLQLSDITIGGFDGTIQDILIYDRVLSQDEIVSLYDKTFFGSKK